MLLGIFEGVIKLKVNIVGAFVWCSYDKVSLSTDANAVGRLHGRRQPWGRSGHLCTRGGKGTGDPRSQKRLDRIPRDLNWDHIPDNSLDGRLQTTVIWNGEMTDFYFLPTLYLESNTALFCEHFFYIYM